MIATPTGSASNMWVVDVDRDPVRNIDGTAALAKLISQHGELPPTLMTITPRGGRHLIFAWDNGVEIRNSTGKVGQGIDVRGEGGYVCLPPSRRADGALYQWDPAGASQAVAAPSWLIELARSENRSRKRDKAWARAALERECEIVAKARPGTRNNTLNTAAFNLFQIVAGGKLDEQEVRDRLFKAAEACGLVADDGAPSVQATIDSAAQAAKAHPRSRPSVQPQPQQQSGRPTIRIIAGELPRIVNEAEAALLAAGGFNLYQRGGLLVRPVLSKLKASNNRETFAWRLVAVRQPYMIETMMRAAEFERWDARARGFVPKDCPAQVADTYLAREGHWRLPTLLGIVNAPFLRIDGTICDQPGYDAASELLFEPDGQNFPTIASDPTKDDAAAALAYLDETLLRAFPFVKPVDRSVALSGILTAFDRRSMATAPLHALHLSGRWYREKPTGRYPVAADQRPDCSRHLAGTHRGGAREASGDVVDERGHHHQHRQLRPHSGKRLPVPGAHPAAIENPGSGAQPAGGDPNQRRDLCHRQQFGDCQRSRTAIAAVRDRRQVRAPRAAPLRLQRGRDHPCQPRALGRGGPDRPAGVARGRRAFVGGALR